MDVFGSEREFGCASNNNRMGMNYHVAEGLIHCATEAYPYVLARSGNREYVTDTDIFLANGG